MIYLDNAATSFPKPQNVINSVKNAMENYGANPGRSGYEMAIKTAEKIYESREILRSFFNVKSVENIVFTQNCTAAVNICIKTFAKKGKNFVCSSLEHNAVARPLEKIKRDGICNYSIAEVDLNNDDITVKNFDRLINIDTAAVIITAASNVCGLILPVKRISALCKKRNIPLIVDGAQAAGVIPLDCSELGIDYLCVAAHKGLFAPLGTGVLVINSNIIPDTVIEGGTGSNSLSLLQPDFLPDRLESGTMNTSSVIAVKSGVEFVNKIGVENIYFHEYELMSYMEKELRNMKNVTVYSDFAKKGKCVPVLSFGINGINSEQISYYLAEKGICVRGGYHCSYLAHKSLGTIESGTVRISPSFFTKIDDIYFTINNIYKLQK